MIKVFVKTVLWWICPGCGYQNEIEDRFDKSIPDELECSKCDHVAEKWELDTE